MTYDPRPVDTSGIRLSPEVLELTERLAENAHDHWARRRLSEGWRYGPRRDDQRKEHPCLVPYADLPDAEQEYDRSAALDTLRAILALGYRLERAGSGRADSG